MTAANKISEIDVTISEPQWKASHLDVETIARTAMTHTIEMASLPRKLRNRAFEISIVLANDDLIQVLNRTYRNMDKPTNVLSFAAIDADSPVPAGEPYPLGDIILSYQTLDHEAKAQDKFFKDHFTHMIVHGTLHLLGYDQQNVDDANAMES